MSARLWGRLYDPHCKRCPLHKEARTVCVPGSGVRHYRYMVVGEAPGRQEDSVGKPFVGAAGQVLNTALADAFFTEFAREETFVTNAVKCRPPANRKPTTDEIDTCFSYLAQEIALIDPVCILALGNVACEALLSPLPAGITAIRGQWHKLDREKLTLVMPTFHPAYVLYNGGIGSEVWEVFLSDVRTFANKVIAKGYQ